MYQDVFAKLSPNPGLAELVLFMHNLLWHQHKLRRHQLRKVYFLVNLYPIFIKSTAKGKLSKKKERKSIEFSILGWLAGVLARHFPY